jgi:hypothetical protein
MTGNGELGVLGIFAAIALALYVVTWSIAGPPGAVVSAAPDGLIPASVSLAETLAP